MEETLNQLVSDVSTLTWLLRLLIAFLFVVIVVLIYFLKQMLVAVKNTEFRAEARIFQDQAEVLLDEGKNIELRELAEVRIREFQSDTWAHYYLGMALYRLRDYILAKQHFMKVIELNPQFKSAAEENLKEIESILSETKPRIV